MNLDFEIFITNLDKRQIVNEKTGEVSDWCMVTYFVKKEDTEKSRGPVQLTCYCKPNAWSDLNEYRFKWAKAKMSQSIEKNRMKLKIKSIDKYVVS